MRVIYILFFSYIMSFAWASQFHAEVTVSALNVRNMPSPNGKKMDLVSQGDVVNVEKEINGWYKIGREKWISSKYTKKVNNYAKSDLYKEIENRDNSYKDEYILPRKHDRGRLTDFVKVDLLYSYEIMSLRIENEIATGTAENKTILADGGNYEFDPISLESKKIAVSLYNTALSYENITSMVDDPKNTLEEQLKVDIKELIGGYGKIKQPTNVWLNHLAKFQLFKRDAVFSGVYQRGDQYEEFEIDKTKYSFKVLLSTDDIFRGSDKIADEPIYPYFQIDYEDHTCPQLYILPIRMVMI